MKYAVALREPPLAALWTSQVLSGIGDQLYMLAAMWIAVQKFGSQAGYVAAAIGIGKISFGIFGGFIADRYNRKNVLIVSDIVRAFAVAPLPIIASRGDIQLWHLVVTGGIMGAFGAFFDPALQSALPSITKSQNALEAMTGLMDLTQRLARALGPSLTGALVTIMPISQFFTIEAISFLISALTILSLGSRLTWQKVVGEENEIDSLSISVERKNLPHFSLQDLLRESADGFKAAARNKALSYGLFNLIFQAGFWGIAFTVGVPLFVKQAFADDVANYGYLVAAYGLGSVAGNVLCANLHIRSSWFNVFMADAICGLGFACLTFSQNMQAAAACAVLAAIGGAAGDLLLLDRTIKEVPAGVLGKVMSTRMMVISGGHALGLMMAAPIFKLGPAQTVMTICGVQ